MSERPGPEPGSVREDQGLIAFYHVHDFDVRGCRFEGSRSDATHFYRCRRGHFVQNKVYTAQMGGYFLEGCQDVTASDNVIRDNGSRGVTIERGSRRCTLQNNIVSGSGREGLWAPNCSGLLVTGNVFERNGRKPNGGPGQVWNANITVDCAAHDPTHSPTQDYLIAHNLFDTDRTQIAALRVDASQVGGIVVRGNVLRGENRTILVQGPNRGSVTVEDNDF
jgi:parallel beta-helix repeat protein